MEESKVEDCDEGKMDESGGAGSGERLSALRSFFLDSTAAFIIYNSHSTSLQLLLPLTPLFLVYSLGDILWSFPATASLRHSVIYFLVIPVANALSSANHLAVVGQIAHMDSISALLSTSAKVQRLSNRSNAEFHTEVKVLISSLRLSLSSKAASSVAHDPTLLDVSSSLFVIRGLVFLFLDSTNHLCLGIAI